MSRHAGLEPEIFAECLTRRAQKSSAVLSNKAEGREGIAAAGKAPARECSVPIHPAPRLVLTAQREIIPGRERETFLEIPPPCRRGCVALKDPRASAPRAAALQASSLAALESTSKG